MIQSAFRTWSKWLLAGCLCLLPATGAWAAVTYVSSSVGSLANSNVSSVQINNPTGLVAGDLMVAFLAQNNPGAPIVSSATGWTNVLSRTYTDGSTVGTSVYYRFATAADISNGSVTFSFTSSRRSAGAILAFRGVDTVTPINASGSLGNNASTSLTAPSITTVDNNTMLVALYGFVQGSNAATPPTGMTEAFDAATGAGPNGVTIEGAYAVQAAVGTTGTRVATAVTTSVNVGVLLALSPVDALDHLQIEYPGDGLTCTPSTVTVKACANATCSLLYTGGGVSGTLSPGGASFAIGIAGFTSATVSSTTSPATLSATYTPATPNVLTCLNTVTNSTSCAMNFNNAGFLFAAAADGAEATIPAQVAGTASSTYYLRAVRTGTTSRACEAALTGTQSVNLGYQCNNPTTCSGSNLMSVNGGTPTVIARNDNGVSASSTGVNLTFDANGNAPLSWTYGDVGQVTLLANKTVGGAVLNGATNSFVVKPGGFVVSDIKQTASPQLANPAAGGAAGARFVMAGESFTATVTATTSGGVATPNYGRETQPEGVNLATALVLPAGGSNAMLTNGLIAGGSFSNGVATVNNLSWGEVGIMTLTPRVGDGDYLGAGDVVGTTTSNLGRFYPAKFSISAASLTPACVPGAPATSFTYFGEDGFTTAFTLTAQSLTGGTTTNYRDAFAKLDLTLYGSFGFSAAALPAGSSLSGSATAPSGSWVNGVASVTAKHQISRPTGLTAPTSAALTAAPTDGEVPAASPAMALGSTTLRYGRLQLLNAYGSELLALPLTLRAQYWNGSAWVMNSDDSCTAITAPTSGSGLTFYAEVAAGAPGNHLSATETTATVNGTGKLASGDAGLRFSRPGSGNSGYVDISIPLAARPWLQYPWGTSAVNPTGMNPTGRATFGIYKSRLIYSRENY